VLGLREEVRVYARVDLPGARDALGQQLLAAGLELAVQLGHERERLRGEDLRLRGADLGKDLDAFGRGDRAHVSGTPFVDTSTTRA